MAPPSGPASEPEERPRAADQPSSLCIHAGEGPVSDAGAVNPPIHQSTTFRFPEKADGSKAEYIYSRYTNPSLESVEAKLAALEGSGRANGQDAARGGTPSSLVFASGMAATSSLCTTLLRPGDRIMVQEGVYGGTTAYFHDELRSEQIETQTFALDGAVHVPEDTRIVWMESISNPLLRVPDLRAWADAAHEVDAFLVVDATFATPILQRPMDLGADFVVHSASKYLGGHSDVTAGFVTCAHGHRDALWQRRRNLGGVLDPHAAYLLGRGMKTLAIRMREHCHNAAGLAEAVGDHDAVQAVHYPGLPDHADHEVASRMLHGGFGGMLSLDLGSYGAAKSFRRACKMILPAASLGGVESLVSLPVETSHAYAPPEVRKREGITDGLVRISVGIEDLADLEADVMQALDAALAAEGEAPEAAV